MKSTITWIVAADGGRVRIFENRGPGKGLVPVPGLNLEDAHLRTQDINSDRPGRTASTDGRGSAMTPQTDAAEQRETAFAKKVAAVLKDHFEQGAYSRLIVAADPTALGNLREALCEAVDRTIVAELPKDLTKVPLGDMPKHFEGLLAI